MADYANVGVATVQLIMSCIGFGEFDAVPSAVVKGMSSAAKIGLASLVADIQTAETVWKKGWAIWKTFMGIYNAVGYSAFVQALELDMAWYDWVLTGVGIVASLFALMSSGGTALIALIVGLFDNMAVFAEAMTDVFPCL